MVSFTSFTLIQVSLRSQFHSFSITSHLFSPSQKLDLCACLHGLPSILTMGHIIFQACNLVIFYLNMSYHVMSYHFDSFRNHFIAHLALGMKVPKFDPWKNLAI